MLLLALAGSKNRPNECLVGSLWLGELDVGQAWPRKCGLRFCSLSVLMLHCEYPTVKHEILCGRSWVSLGEPHSQKGKEKKKKEKAKTSGLFFSTFPFAVLNH